MKRSAIKRKTPLRPMSKKRTKESRIYSARRKAFLTSNPVCFTCELFSNPEEVVCSNSATEIHYRKKRGKFYLDESTWMAVCRPCHRFIHANPAHSRAAGFLL